jgi:hypothetical protein
MARMAIETLTPGLKLNKPVFNLNGILLLKAGEALTAKHLGIFKTWGVREVDVLQEDGAEPAVGAEPAGPPELLARARREVAHRFRRSGVEGNAVMAEIHRVAERRQIARLLAEAGSAAQGGR